MAGEEITIDNLRQLLSIQTDLREQAETRWRKAQRVLVSLLETFAPEEVDQRLKNGRPLDHLPVDELEQLVRQQVGNRLHHVQRLLNDSQAAQRVQNLREQLEKLMAQNEELQKENRQLQDQINHLETEKTDLLNRLAALGAVLQEQQQTNAEQEPGGSALGGSAPPEPVWMATWRQAETFERDAGILKMIAETGLARRPVIEALAAALLGIKKAGGSLQALLTRLEDLHLIERFRPWTAEGAGTGGKFPDLVRLTDQGRLAYWLLTSQQPQANEYDLLLERHVSPEHTLLNLQAADALREAGYQVDLTPQEITLPDGGLFRPDLAIVDDQGATHFVEVERDVDKNLEQRQAKWRNFCQASGGRMFVVCDNRSCMRNIRSEINYCLGNKPLAVSLTNLADLQTGKRGEGDSVWLETRIRG
jgi:regulator of replication initiation timing